MTETLGQMSEGDEYVESHTGALSLSSVYEPTSGTIHHCVAEF